MRMGHSRLFVPHATYVPPDHIPSFMRVYEEGVGRVKRHVEGRWVRRPCRKDDSRGVNIVVEFEDNGVGEGVLLVSGGDGSKVDGEDG